jgi:hypothetical protein
VGRLSEQDGCSALDWAELGRDTVTWGQHLRSGNQQVPEGPVRDALAAVDIGSRSDPKASDWDRLRAELEALLQKQDDKKNQQNQQKSQQQDQQQDQKQDQQQQDKGQKQDQQSQDQKGPQSQAQSPRNPNPEPPKQPDDGRPNQERAFGDLGKQAPTPPPQDESRKATQRVGGVKNDQPNDPARKDPELASALEKLEQVRSKDSPAELFEMLRRSEPVPPPTNTGPNW